MIHPKNSLVNVLLLGTAVALLSPAYAQDAALDEVIVTAERRAESIQDVPIAITSVSTEALTEAGINSTMDLQFVTPGLNVGTQLASAVPFIRGVGSQNTTAGQDAGVALYVDDVYYSSSTGSILSLTNIDRIEVLKGPQGTLFGRNATGGLLHIVTKDPSEDFSGKAELGYGDYETITGSAYVTGGLGEGVATDLAIYFREQGDGFGTNLTTGSDVNELDEFVIRNKWAFNAGPNTDIRLSLDYSKTETTNGTSIRLAPGALGTDGALVFGGCLGAAVDPTAPTDAETQACASAGAAAAHQFVGDFQDVDTNLDPNSEIKQLGVSFIVDHSFGNIDLTSVTAYRENDSFQNLAQAGIPDTIVAPASFLDVFLKQFTDTFSQEIRLSSSGDKFDWIVGVFYLDEKAGYKDGVINGAALSPLTEIRDDNQQDTESLAVFVQGDYRFAEGTTLTAGLRYTEDERSASGVTTLLAGGATVAAVDYEQIPYLDPVTGAAETAEERLNTTFDELTWRLALSQEFGDNSLTYISYNRGFKAGLFNLNVLAPTGPGPAVEPEILDAYEVGFKTELFNNRARLNAAAFFYDYKDLQVGISTPGGNTVLNAAEASMTGGEVELLAAVTNELTINAGISILDTEYDSFPGGPQLIPNPFGGNTQIAADLAGNEVPRSPDTTFNFGAVYEIDTEMGTFTSSANYYYSEGFFWESENRTEQESYSILNAQVTWTDPEDAYYVRFFANNITDEEYSNFSISSALGDFISAAPPLTYGVTVGAKF